MLDVPRNADVIETTSYLLWQGDDGFIRVQYKPNQPVTVDDIKEQLAHIQRLSGGERAYVLGDFSRIDQLTADLETRRYSVSEDAAQVFAASAIIGTTGLARFLGNIYLSVTTPTYPIRIFKSEPEAIEWLLQQQQQQNQRKSS